MENIIIATITVLIPSLTTIFTNRATKIENRKHNAKQSIFQLILEDHVRVSEHRLPENYQQVCTSKYVRSMIPTKKTVATHM